MLVDGSSDEPLGNHVAAMARPHGVALVVVTPPFDRMHKPPGKRVTARLERILQDDDQFDCLVVHRDAERDSVATRVDEIKTAAASAGVRWPTIPVIPVRMTEAWLLLDEQAIRDVAGRPRGTAPLDLPSHANAESDPNPKLTLQRALATASGLSGRRLRKFTRDFPAYRRQLLDRLDRDGPVRLLHGWRALDQATQAAAMDLLNAPICRSGR